MPDQRIDLAARDGTWYANDGCSAYDKKQSRVNRDELIFRWSAEGVSNRAIAEKLTEMGFKCSEGTVRNVLKKGRVRNLARNTVLALVRNFGA